MAILPPPQAMNPLNPIDDQEPEELDEQEGGMQGGAAAFNVSKSSMLLVQLAVQLRTLQLAAHNMHNLVSGPGFFDDHKFFGDAYGAYESAYDDSVERLLGTGPKPNLVMIQQKAVQRLQDTPPDAESMFAMLLDGEKALQQLCEQFEGQASMGVVNLIAGFADASESRAYKLQQRIGGQQGTPQMGMMG